MLVVRATVAEGIGELTGAGPGSPLVVAVDTLLAADFSGFLDAIHHLVLPAFTLATVPMAIIVLGTRGPR